MWVNSVPLKLPNYLFLSIIYLHMGRYIDRKKSAKSKHYQQLKKYCTFKNVFMQFSGASKSISWLVKVMVTSPAGCWAYHFFFNC